MSYFSLEQEIKEINKAESAEGSLAPSADDKLMRSVLQNDKKKIEEGEMIEEALNRNITSFTPDITFENLVNNYQMAKKILGPKIIRFLTGYDDKYVEKNLRIPEFKKEIKKNIEKNISSMMEDKLLDRHGGIKDKGIQLASLILYMKELDKFLPRGFFGEKVSKEKAHYGEKSGIEVYKKGARFKDLAIRQSVRMAIKRNHSELLLEDLRVVNRVKKGTIYVVYALDASASMKGKKIGVAKRAGVALTFKAISQKDKVGLIVFSKDVREAIAPTNDFSMLLNKITAVTASKQTDFVKMIKKSTEVFPRENVTKHLLVLTDAIPTAGERPESETLKAISIARNAGITISIVGIGLDKKGEKFARKCTQLGNGRLYMVRNLDNVDKIVLQDYDRI